MASVRSANRTRAVQAGYQLYPAKPIDEHRQVARR
jgi:hypothetical protein